MIDLAEADRILDAPDPFAFATIGECIDAVIYETGISQVDLVSDRRGRGFARPRQMVMWLGRKTTKASLPMIGRRLNRDHTTVMHGANTIERLRFTDATVWDLSERCMARLALVSNLKQVGIDHAAGVACRNSGVGVE